MYPPSVGDTVRMSECVAILSPSEVPVEVSGTCFVSTLFDIVLSRLPDITIGMLTNTSSHRLLTPAYMKEGGGRGGGKDKGVCEYKV